MSDNGAAAAGLPGFEVVWAPGMSEEETAYRIEYARWRHGGRDGARRRIDQDVLDGVKKVADAAAELAELDARATYVERRLAVYAEERAAVAAAGSGGRGRRRPRAIAR